MYMVRVRVRVRIRVSVRVWVRFRVCHDMFRTRSSMLDRPHRQSALQRTQQSASDAVMRMRSNSSILLALVFYLSSVKVTIEIKGLIKILRV